jgi:hypothetical protein
VAATIGNTKIHPVEEEDKMSRNPILFVVLALVVAILAVLTIRTATATSAVIVPAQDNYDAVERIRASRDSRQSADFSYDEVERIRSMFTLTRPADGSSSAPDLSDYALRHRYMFAR